MELIPDTHGEGKKATQYVKKSLSPTYNEIFTFRLEEEEISQTQLRVRVLSHDPFGKADFMGENIIHLANMDFSEIITRWFELQPEVKSIYLFWSHGKLGTVLVLDWLLDKSLLFSWI